MYCMNVIEWMYVCYKIWKINKKTGILPQKMYVQYRFLYLIPTRNKITVYTSNKCVKNKGYVDFRWYKAWDYRNQAIGRQNIARFIVDLIIINIRLERLLENKFNFTSIGLKTNVILFFFFNDYCSTPIVFLAELNFRAAKKWKLSGISYYRTIQRP